MKEGLSGQELLCWRRDNDDDDDNNNNDDNNINNSNKPLQVLFLSREPAK